MKERVVKPAPVCRRGFCWQYEGSKGRLLQDLGAMAQRTALSMSLSSSSGLQYESTLNSSIAVEVGSECGVCCAAASIV